MQFDTKIAVIIRTDLEPWQKLNVASFLAGGIAAINAADGTRPTISLSSTWTP